MTEILDSRNLLRCKFWYSRLMVRHTTASRLQDSNDHPRWLARSLTQVGEGALEASARAEQVAASSQTQALRAESTMDGLRAMAEAAAAAAMNAEGHMQEAVAAAHHEHDQLVRSLGEHIAEIRHVMQRTQARTLLPPSSL